MQEQRERSRSARSSQSNLILQKSVKTLPSKFVGYEKLDTNSEILGIFSDSGEVEVAKEGDELAIVVSETPFYAESGGQVGDVGRIFYSGGSCDVVDTQKASGGTIAHIVKVTDGEIRKGEIVSLEIDKKRRREIAQNHSATHVLHLALRKVLGEHIKQAGSRVSDLSLRFDFTHPSTVTAAQLKEIFKFCNQYLLNNFKTTTHVLPINEAQKLGAVALFGEKYGELVRVVELGENSKEFCGGPHVSALGEIGQMHLVSESSVSSGVRRIEAVAGMRAYTYIADIKQEFDRTQSLLQAPKDQVFVRVERLMESNKALEKKSQSADQTNVTAKATEIAKNVKTGPQGIAFVSSLEMGVPLDQLKVIADDVRNRLGSVVVILGSEVEEKGHLLIAITKDLSPKIHAGNLIKEILPLFNGRGGGKPDMAQAGGDPKRLKETISKVETLVS